MPQTQTELAALVARMPDADDPGKESTFTGPEPPATEKIFAEILSGGPERIAELIRLLRACTDPDFKDYRAEYVLHGLVVYAGHPDRPELGRMLTGTLAAHVGRSDLSAGVRGMLIRELQWVGGAQAVAALAGRLQDEELCSHAVSALIAIGTGAAPALRQALPQAQGRNRLAIVEALGVLGDGEAVGALREAAADEHRELRIAAVWALAHIGDAGSIDVLIKAADAEDAWERIEGARSALLLAEKLHAAGKKDAAAKLYTHLYETRTDPTERHVREAAARGLKTAK